MVLYLLARLGLSIYLLIDLAVTAVYMLLLVSGGWKTDWLVPLIAAIVWGFLLAGFLTALIFQLYRQNPPRVSPFTAPDMSVTTYRAYCERLGGEEPIERRPWLK